jgi:hypothetical protein
MPTVSLHEDHAEVVEKLMELYEDLFRHEGYGSMSVEIKFLKKGQKEVLIRCGKDYRYVIDYVEGRDLKILKRLKSFQLAT